MLDDTTTCLSVRKALLADVRAVLSDRLRLYAFTVVEPRGKLKPGGKLHGTLSRNAAVRREGRMTSTFLRPFLTILLLGTLSAGARGLQFSGALVVSAADIGSLKDYSSAAAGLFNNMRTPALLVGGAIVPVGLLAAPQLDKGKDTSQKEFYKELYVMVAVISLLNEILAVTYSTIEVNKLAEIKSAPMTEGVDALIAHDHELAWLGTNIHFLVGLIGFGLLVGAKPYFLYGKSVGDITACWALAAILQSVSIVNRGIALGDGSGENTGKFASNLFTLTLRYLQLLSLQLNDGILPIVSVSVSLYSVFLLCQLATNQLASATWQDRKTK